MSLQVAVCARFLSLPIPPAARQGAAGRSETCRRPSMTIGEATPGMPPRSMRMPRATTCGSANTSATSLIGPAGMPAARARQAGRRAALWPTSGASGRRAPAGSPPGRHWWRSGHPRPARPAEQRAEPAELRVVAHRDDDVTVGDGEALVGHDIRMRVAHPVRRLARDQIVHRLVGEHGHLRIEQRHVDMAALPVASRSAQRRQDRDRRIEAGEDIGEGDADLLRLAGGLAGQVHDPAHALDDEVVAGARGIGPSWPKPVIEQ